MYENYRAIFSKIVDVDAVVSEAMAISGHSNPHMDLIMALTVKAIAAKQEQQINELKEQIFINTGKSLQQMEDEGKFNNVVDLASVRHMKEADANLAETIENFDAEMLMMKAEFDKERAMAAQLNKDITIGDEYDSYNVYLQLGDTIIGIHAVGHAGQHQYTQIELDQSRTTKSTDFYVMEIWGNEYDEQHNMLGRGSFRIHSNNVEEVVKEYEAEGWARRGKPGEVSTPT